MKFSIYLPLALLFLLVTACQSNSDEYFTQTAKIPDNLSKEEKVRFSTRVLPHDRQMNWFNDEFFGFIHYGPNTYSGREWGTGMEEAALFNPGDLDTDQWCRLMKEAGIKRVIMVVKHHDGYCLWQTRYTDHSVASSPWKDGQGDVLEELTQSAEKYGLKVGIYLSPADLYQIESENGYYGNGSEFTQREIPRQVEGRPFEDDRTFTYKVDDYNEYFLNQLFELLTEYGPIYEVWFDGANPKPGTGQTYTYDAWFDMIRDLAPEAVIFGKGPDARWCGNEGGATRDAEYNVIPLPVSPDDFDWPDMTDENLAGRDQITEKAQYFHYYPAETNTSIRDGWFWRNDDEQQVRTADDVFDIYERSVGGNSIFLLNIPPNPKGQFSPRDARVLKEVGSRIEAVYGSHLPFGSENNVPEVTDQDASTWWSPASEDEWLEVHLSEKTAVNRFVLSEAIADRGERVEEHVLEARINGAWKKVAEGKTIGHKRILRFPVIETNVFRVRMSRYRAKPCIAEVSAHYYDEPPKPVAISRNSSGEVVLGVGTSFTWNNHGATDASQTIYYTLDGSEPDDSARSYEGPFAFPEGGIVKARAIVEGEKGAVSEKIMGIHPSGWEVSIDGDDAENATHIIDGNERSAWIAEEKNNGRFPDVTIRLDQAYEIGGFSYLPPAHESAFVESWTVWSSNDGENWKKLADGEFGNIINDPSKRTFFFESPVRASYFRITGLGAPANQSEIGISEIELLPAGEQF
ncbi:MAG: alpha-L-fucosidase [Marinilabilia sp.]